MSPLPLFPSRHLSSSTAATSTPRPLENPTRQQFSLRATNCSSGLPPSLPRDRLLIPPPTSLATCLQRSQPLYRQASPRPLLVAVLLADHLARIDKLFSPVDDHIDCIVDPSRGTRFGTLTCRSSRCISAARAIGTPATARTPDLSLVPSRLVLQPTAEPLRRTSPGFCFQPPLQLHLFTTSSSNAYSRLSAPISSGALETRRLLRFLLRPPILFCTPGSAKSPPSSLSPSAARRCARRRNSRLWSRPPASSRSTPRPGPRPSPASAPARRAPRTARRSACPPRRAARPVRYAGHLLSRARGRVSRLRYAQHVVRHAVSLTLLVIELCTQLTARSLDSSCFI